VLSTTILSVIGKNRGAFQESNVTIIFQALGVMKSTLRRYAFAAAFLMLASYAYITLRGPRGIHAVVEKKAQIQELEKRNADRAREIERKRAHIRRLQDNPAEQELEIRERLKLAHPGETIFIIGDPKKK
jgi:cell division protein FtsB